MTPLKALLALLLVPVEAASPLWKVLVLLPPPKASVFYSKQFLGRWRPQPAVQRSFSFNWIWIYLVLRRTSSVERNECHLSVLLSLSCLNSKTNQYETFSLITSARKGQSWHKSLSAKYKHEKVPIPYKISLIIDTRLKAQLTFT